MRLNYGYILKTKEQNQKTPQRTLMFHSAPLFCMTLQDDHEMADECRRKATSKLFLSFKRQT